MVRRRRILSAQITEGDLAFSAGGDGGRRSPELPAHVVLRQPGIAEQSRFMSTRPSSLFSAARALQGTGQLGGSRRVPHRLVYDGVNGTLAQKLLEQIPQLEHRSRSSVGHDRMRGVVRFVDHPVDNPWCIATWRSALAFPSLRSDWPLGPASAGEGQDLPTILAGNDCRVVTGCNECPASVFDDVKLRVFFIDIERTAEVQHRRVEAVEAARGEQNPVGMIGGLTRVALRLERIATMGDDIAEIKHRPRFPSFDLRRAAELEAKFFMQLVEFAAQLIESGPKLISVFRALVGNQLSECVV